MRITIEIDGADDPGRLEIGDESKPAAPARTPLSQLEVADVHDAGAAPPESGEVEDDSDAEVTDFLEGGAAAGASAGEAPS